VSKIPYIVEPMNSKGKSDKPGIFRFFHASLARVLVFIALMTVLFLFIPPSCNDESGPLSTDEEETDCVYYEDYLHLAGSVDTPGFASNVAVSGTYAYIADRQADLQVLHRQCER
jgi:hypothetical protein